MLADFLMGVSRGYFSEVFKLLKNADRRGPWECITKSLAENPPEVSHTHSCGEVEQRKIEQNGAKPKTLARCPSASPDKLSLDGNCHKNQ